MSLKYLTDYMAAKVTSAQHFVQCEECEENPAKYVCKTCPGQLCKECKTKHEKRKISKNHKITLFSTQNTEFADLLYCPKHKEKKLECFCGRCKIPICTECIIVSHNGHKIQKFRAVFKEVRDNLQKKKYEIEKTLLPQYTMMLAEEREKRSELSKQAEAIESQIKNHTRQIIERTQEISKNALKDLKEMENEGLEGIDRITEEYEKKISKLKQTNEMLSGNIETKPGILFFHPAKKDVLKEFRTIPMPVYYELTSFQPGNIKQKLRKNFGRLPRLEKKIQKVWLHV